MGWCPRLPARLSAARRSETEMDVVCALGAGLHVRPPPGQGWGRLRAWTGPTAALPSHADELSCQSWRCPGVAPLIPSFLALRLRRLPPG